MNTQKLLSVPAGVLIKTTLVDYPGRVACTFFLRGCNLRCPYCYNKELVTDSNGQNISGFVSSETVMAHLIQRKNVLSGFVISGGEPLLNPLTPELIRKARSLGYKIKLDTNGTLPDQLQELLADKAVRPDFIAMDIKTAPARYEKELAPHLQKKQYTDPVPPVPFYGDFAEKTETYAERLIRSVKLIATYPADSREFRTVLVPGLVAENDIREIASILPPDASWQFAQFRNENCIDTSYNDITPYLDAKLAELVTVAKKIIHGAVLR